MDEREKQLLVLEAASLSSSNRRLAELTEKIEKISSEIDDSFKKMFGAWDKELYEIRISELQARLVPLKKEKESVEKSKERAEKKCQEFIQKGFEEKYDELKEKYDFASDEAINTIKGIVNRNRENALKQ